MRKRRFTLIEMMISLGLLSVLLWTLFSTYGTLSLQKERAQERRWPLKEERYAEQQLLRSLPKANVNPYFFTTEEGGLVFTFDNGPQRTPELSNTVLGHLYVDPASHTLLLGIWPLWEQSPEQTVVLLKDVDSIAFNFYYPQDTLKKPVDPQMVGNTRPEPGWQTEWLHTYGELPPLVKLSVLRGEREIAYAFDLKFAQKPIVYAK